MHFTSPDGPADGGVRGHVVAAIRDFNRLYTRQLGLLEPSYLGSRLNLTEARVLYELAARERPTAGDIARDLRIDVAYLSRILSKFRRRRWVRRETSASDRRQYRLQLTAAGRAAFAPLDQSAARQVSEMLGHLPPADRTSLVSSMNEIRRVLSDGTPGEFLLRGLAIGDIGWIIHRQGLLYAQEYGWDQTYEALVAQILSDFVRKFDPQTDAAWVAEQGGRIMGSVFLVRVDADLAKLRLLYVEPSARGSGLGKRLVRECIAGAKARGYRKLTLWTNDVLLAARHIYEAAGFRLTKEEPHHSFGKDLVGQTWDLDLA